ncbi:MAG: [FeFe] hydrogenase, group A [Clostridiales bacterium]|jgi:NADH-quinone oxidoreductase subunit G|nr:[FeFe] hydrogenase, group A [Clostridiales bacterium]
MRAQTASIDKMLVPIEGEKNLLELCRKAGIELPTFCYHSEISVYGACRMCMVELEGRGIVPACSTKPEAGMVVRTNTGEIRSMRKMIIELMLANHAQSCFTCKKSGDCRLQSIAKQLGVDTIRFKKTNRDEPLDLSSKAIVRDPGKCILCGDCVRVCSEIQSVGALDFAYRGAKAQVGPCYSKGIGEIECVGCGQCVKVCPVGALTPKYQVAEVWNAIHDSSKKVVVQVAPAVRVALGEYFGKEPGSLSMGRIITALRRMGFDRVYDTCFGADFTVIEEGKEFLKRRESGKNLPLFTSCCPAWVKFAEQYFPDFLGNLSSCRSPQQMFASLCKEQLPAELGITREELVVVSVMPCTAKKFEASREEFQKNGIPDVDYVVTTQELALMIKESGIDFNKLELGSFDMPFGFSTGASVIFGSSGGVSEAVLRFAAETLEKGSSQEFRQLRGLNGIKTAEITIGKETLSMVAVSGLANARKVIDQIRSGEASYDLVEVMACSGGCVNGGGQPVCADSLDKRAKGLYDSDKMLQFHVSSENPYLQQIYAERLDDHKSHELLHTKYKNRKRIDQEELILAESSGERVLTLEICFGTSCFVRGAQQLYQDLMEYIRSSGLEDKTQFKASFCGQQCKKGPVLSVNGKSIEKCTRELAISEIEKALNLV